MPLSKTPFSPDSQVTTVLGTILEPSQGLVTVYHQDVREGIFHPGFNFGPKFEWPGKYRAVARIACETLDDAYRMTQNVSDAWATDKSCGSLVGERCRSSMVGDIIEKDGDFYMVMSMGFSQVKDGKIVGDEEWPK